MPHLSIIGGALLGSTVVVSLLAFGSQRLRDALILVPYRVRKQREVYRLLTAGLIHSDFGHLLFNLLTFWFFASDVERVLGEARFLVLYISAVVVAFVPTTLRHMRRPNYSSLGASGAVSAITFSAIALIPKLRLSLMFLPIPMPGWAYGIGYLVYSAYRSRRDNDGINHDAHFAGALYGAGLTFVFEPERVRATLASLLPH
jgi:membrane associated rhomboid family serine protease